MIKTEVVGVIKKINRVVAVGLVLEESIMSVISVYSPQIGCTDEKNSFWWDIGQVIQEVSGNKKIIIGGNLNGHVEKGRRGIEVGVLEREIKQEKRFWSLHTHMILVL